MAEYTTYAATIAFVSSTYFLVAVGLCKLPLVAMETDGHTHTHTFGGIEKSLPAAKLPWMVKVHFALPANARRPAVVTGRAMFHHATLSRSNATPSTVLCRVRGDGGGGVCGGVRRVKASACLLADWKGTNRAGGLCARCVCVLFFFLSLT